MADGLRIDATDVAEVVTGLKAARKDLGREQRRANKVVGEKVAGWARSDARRGTRQQAKYADAIQGRSTQRYARVTVVARGANRGASAAFFGQRPLTRTGWNASRYDRSGKRLGGRRRLPGARPQGLPWVGNTWIAGLRGEGPYVINDTIARHMPEIETMLAEAPTKAIEQAFTPGSIK